MDKNTSEQNNISGAQNKNKKYQKALQKFKRFSEPANSRELAFVVLYQVYVLDAFSDIAINRTFNKSSLNQQDKSISTAFILGTLIETVALDALIKKLAKININKLDPRILVILRLGLWQIYYSNQAVHAAVSETVKLCRRFGVSSAKSLVNAILRNSIRKYPINQFQINQFDKYTHTGFNQELYEHFLKELGNENEVKELASYLKTSPSLNVRLRFSDDKNKVNQIIEIKNSLEEEGVTSRKAHFQEDSLHLELNGKSLHQTKAWISGLLRAQGESAMLPAIALNPHANEKIADICAAPGGKTIQISDLSQGKSNILASDIQVHRVELLNTELRRLGIENIETKVSDASDKEQWKDYENHFDKVLLDVPCSGLGLLQSKPELRFKWGENKLSKLLKLQRKILEVAGYILKPGGVMLYSTCTLNYNENSMQVHNFIKNNPRYELISMHENLETIKDNLIKLDPSLEQQMKQGEITLWPHKVLSEGFYLALIKKH